MLCLADYALSKECLFGAPERLARYDLEARGFYAEAPCSNTADRAGLLKRMKTTATGFRLPLLEWRPGPLYPPVLEVRRMRRPRLPRF